MIESLDLTLKPIQREVEEFYGARGLRLEPLDYLVGLFEGGKLLGLGGRRGDVIQQIALHPEVEGEGRSREILTALFNEAYGKGLSHLFLYTVPGKSSIFEAMGFYTVAQTKDLVLLEKGRPNIWDYLQSLPQDQEEKSVVVINANPFTLGHRALIEQALDHGRKLWVFVVEEDQSYFSTKERVEMVQRGTQDLPLQIFRSGPYMISRSTFPTYFLKEREDRARVYARLDVEVFLRYFVPTFHFVERYVGEEPEDEATSLYNEALKALEPMCRLRVIPRKKERRELISASRVREYYREGNWKALRSLVPTSTYEFLKDRHGKTS